MTPVGRCVVLIAGAILIPTSIALTLALAWWQQWQSAQVQLHQTRRAIAHEQRRLAQLPGLRAAVQAAAASPPLAGLAFEAATPALIGAQLQRRLQAMVRGAGARVISTQILPARAGDGPVMVKARMQMQSSLEALLAVLSRLEAAEPVIFIDKLSVRAEGDNPFGGPAKGSRLAFALAPTDAAPTTLLVRMDVSVYAAERSR